MTNDNLRAELTRLQQRLSSAEIVFPVLFSLIRYAAGQLDRAQCHVLTRSLLEASASDLPFQMAEGAGLAWTEQDARRLAQAVSLLVADGIEVWQDFDLPKKRSES